jgi:hypothetical protein
MLIVARALSYSDASVAFAANARWGESVRMMLARQRSAHYLKD